MREVAPDAMLEQAARVLRVIAESPEARRASADLAYAHPNGFIKIPLGSDANGFTLRLHYWGNHYPDASNTHSHRWNMSSLILQGHYRAIDYAEGSVGCVCSKFLCSENSHGEYTINSAGASRIDSVRDQVYNEGDVYQLEAGAIHSIIETSTDLPVISLVECSAPVFENSVIYTLDAAFPANPGATPVDQAQVRIVAIEALAAICRLQARC